MFPHESLLCSLYVKKAKLNIFPQRVLREKDFISIKKHTGWYSVSDEAFYPESQIEQVLYPPTGQTIVVSKETGKTVEWMEEENYHFKLSQMGPELLKFYKANPDWIIPKARYDFVVAEVERGLEDLSISRPKERLRWGIPVPGDPSQTIYVWLDALINYITFAGYPWTPGTQTPWPADVQIIGKDILRFHCIYWPAFLLAVGLQPAKRVLSHAHWTMSHQKMSKSVGNVVDPIHAMKKYGVDTVRFYLCHDGGIANDGDYANQELEEKYHKFLTNQLGNLLSRLCAPVFDIEGAVSLYSGLDGEVVKPEMTEALRTHYDVLTNEVLEGLRNRVTAKMDAFDLSAALKEILSAVSETHKYIHATELWQKEKAHLRAYMIYPAVEILRISGILLQPFMPKKMELLLDALKVEDRMRTWQSADVGADSLYGKGTSGTKVMLFPRLPLRDSDK